ncbi:MAG: T9SS type A sorting domain-containing protein [Saprospiraceae bacterium]
MKKIKTIRILTLLLLSIFSFGKINAQCILTCNDLTNFLVLPGESLTIEPSDILEGNITCSNLQINFNETQPTASQFSPTVDIPANTYGIFLVAVASLDGQGNIISICWGNMIITEPQDCSADVTPPVAVCDVNTYVSLIAGDDLDFPATSIDDGSYDGCTSIDDLSYFITTDPSLTAPPSTETIFIPSGTNGTITAFLWVVDEAGNANVCATDIIVETKQMVVGNIFIDENQDCLYDANNENSIGGFGVQYTIDQGVTFIPVQVSSNGSYAFAVEGQAGMEITVEVILPNGITSNCTTSENIILPFTATVIQDFSVELADDCDNMTVDISTGILRSCVPFSYNVNYCNLSAYDIDDAELHVIFPPDFSIFGAQIPYTDLGNNELLFDLGTVSSGVCDQFNIDVLLSCNVPLGATKCVEASISPNSCLDSQNSWTGSTLQVTGECDEADDVVRFKIENIGGGDMQSSLNYIVIEDVVMSMTEPIQLPLGGIETVEVPANGSTWRLEIPQEPGHPYLSIPSAAIEGCENYGSMGFITQFSTPDVESFVAIDCQEVVASYDPNDKQAYPTGYATENFIEQNTSIEYKIRFQNTGNDTAFYVRLEDRISEHLDITSIEPGASSHTYRFELKEDGVINFHFENILLPDSTTNLEESQGFVQFRIHQLADNAIGTVIENTADIYFDFNDAVITNTVHHTIGTNFISTETVQTFVPNLKVGVAPNPFSNFTNITLEGIENMEGEFELYDVMGRLVKTDSFSDNIYRLERNGLSSGTYLFRFINEKGLIANGKLMIQ